MKIYNEAYLTEVQERLDKLDTNTQALWGKMNAPQMLAHLNATYTNSFSKDEKKNGFLMNFMLKKFVKPLVVGDKPYKKNIRTSPAFYIADEREFAKEKKELLANIEKVIQEGEASFEGRKSPNFGPLTAAEWNTLFDKHLQHHFAQFGI